MPRIDRSCDGEKVETMPVHFDLLMTASDGVEPVIVLVLTSELGAHRISLCRICANNLKDCLEEAIRTHPGLARG